MMLWRISNHLDLSGAGGLRAAARWHHAGKPIVYLAGSPAAALLEVMVHLEMNELSALPLAYQLLKVEVPETLTVLELNEDALPADWQNNLTATRDLGDRWLRSMDSAMLAVPSAIVPHTKNYLLNPAHAEAQKVTVVAHGSYPFDLRLFK